MLGGRAGEIVSRRETPSQCGIVGSPAYGLKACSCHPLNLLNYNTLFNSIADCLFDNNPRTSSLKLSVPCGGKNRFDYKQWIKSQAYQSLLYLSALLFETAQCIHEKRSSLSLYCCSSNDCNHRCRDPWLQLLCGVTLTFKISRV